MRAVWRDHFDFSATTIARELEHSLQRLRTDYVDLLLAHDIEFGDVSQIIEETIPMMRRLQRQGKVRYVGITGYWPAFLARVARQTEVDCVLNYCHANLFVEDMDAELVTFAKSANVCLLNAPPLHMGLLSNKPIPSWHPAPQRVQEAALRVRKVCEDHGADPGIVGMHVCLGHPYVASTLVGIGSEEEVLAATAAIGWTPPSGLMQAIGEILEPVRNVVWPSGLAENQISSLSVLGVDDDTQPG